MGSKKSEMQLSGVRSERKQRSSFDLDRLSALEIARLMNRQDSMVVQAVRKALPAIAEAIDIVCDRLAQGGRLIYVGSGTSGRIGALDASECPPTFGSAPEMIQYVIAGGEDALAKASEGCEDSAELGASDIALRRPGKKDVVVGVSASGRTRYTIAALKYAQKKGAATIAIVCSSGSELAKVSGLAIEAVVGAEVLAGSTRLKAGTAEKMICNMLTTGAMARLGYVYGNLMVQLQMKNQKLIERGIAIVQSVAGVERGVAISTLEAADGKVSVALVMLCAEVTKAEAMRRLKRARGNVRRAMEA
ncbi:MAG: N-acetylmuramic acid 6-phosphate etherase [Candidatus Korobacteraceae bacterium]|jgi:N-acetylmuramic acid 6-phosphate etherase